MATEQENEKTKLVSDSLHSCCMGCPEALRVEWRLVPYKAQYFFFYGAISSLFPFLSVFYKQIGMSPTQIGVLYGIKPVLGTISSPLWGAIGDRFRIRKGVLLLSIVVLISSFLIIGNLPTPEDSSTCPPGLPPRTNTSEIESELVHGYKLVINWIYVESDVSHLFVIILVCVMIGEFFWSPIGALGDAALLSVLDESEMHKYSRQRSWGALAMATFQLVTGAVLQTTIHYRDICGLTLRFTNYKVAVYIFTGALCVTFIISTFFKFRYDTKKEVKPSEEELSEFINGIKSTSDNSVMESDSVVQMAASIQSPVTVKSQQAKFSLYKFVRLLCTVHYGSWLLCIAYMGFCNGIILGFLFWYLEELGGDNVLMGVAGGTASGTEFLFFYVSFWFINKLGTINMLYVSLITYALRFTNYALMVNPWLVLPSEVLQGFTFAAGWAAIVQHASDALPPCYLAAIMGTLHGLYWGLGHGCGFLIGGVTIDAIGAKSMFALFIAVTLVFTGFFVLAQKLSVKPVYMYDEDEEEEMAVHTN